MKHSEAGYGLLAYGNPWGCGRASSEARRNTERGSPGDEPGGVRRQGKALKGKNPKSDSGMKQGRRVSEEETLKSLRKAEEGSVRVEPNNYDSLISER